MDWESVQQDVRARFPEVRRVAPATLLRWLDEGGARVLDVRGRDEFEVSHVQGAVHWDGGADPGTLPPDMAIGDRVVVYCAVGYRSSSAVRALQELGYEEVYRLDGDLFGWVNDGHPVVKDGDPTEQVHPFNRRWGRFLRPR